MFKQSEKNINDYFLLFLLIGIALNAVSLFTDIMDQDSALYASVAKHIAISGDWINLIGYGGDWLDKPHLPFWLSAISFKIFGISSFAYKLPSFLCWLVGVYYTYTLANTFYNKSTAQVATIIFITSLHLILANFDVRAEGYLTAFIVAAIFHLYKLYKDDTWIKVWPAALFCAMAVITKGIFVLVTIAAGFLIHWVFTKQWKQFANLKWYALILLVLIFITPELYCLYAQFDLHPEKIVWGKQNVSGIKFFFWDSQFGRFFNTGPIKGKGHPLFFLHTILWAFLPWSIVLIAASVSFFKSIKKNIRSEKVIITASALVTFIVFSMSQFQLPHYIVILFPHFSIICAAWLLTLQNRKTIKTLNITAWIVYIVLIATIVLVIIFFKFENPVLLVACIVVTTTAFIWLPAEDLLTRFIKRGICFALLTSFFIQAFIYTELMRYDAGMIAARWLNQNKKVENTVMLNCNNFPYEFYSRSNVQRMQIITAADFRKQDSSIIVFGNLSSVQKIDTTNVKTEILNSFEYFHITMLNMEFIDKETRPLQTEKYVLAKCTLKK